MNKEELKEYFKRTEKLEKKLTGEDKETIQWMIYGYNQCAKKYFETLEELDKYKNIVDEIERYLRNMKNATKGKYKEALQDTIYFFNAVKKENNI